MAATATTKANHWTASKFHYLNHFGPVHVVGHGIVLYIVSKCLQNGGKTSVLWEQFTAQDEIRVWCNGCSSETHLTCPFNGTPLCFKVNRDFRNWTAGDVTFNAPWLAKYVIFWRQKQLIRTGPALHGSVLQRFVYSLVFCILHVLSSWAGHVARMQDIRSVQNFG
jgi:hypothetical protein